MLVSYYMHVSMSIDHWIIFTVFLLCDIVFFIHCLYKDLVF